VPTVPDVRALAVEVRCLTASLAGSEGEFIRREPRTALSLLFAASKSRTRVGARRIAEFVCSAEGLCDHALDSAKHCTIPRMQREGRMGRFIEGADRPQATLLPETIDDYVGDDNPVPVVDAFVNALD
jgi:hypothetical protein